MTDAESLRAELERLRQENQAQALALAAAEERLRLIVGSATDYAVLTTDSQGTVASWSLGAASAFGYAAEEIVGRTAAVLFTPEDRADGADEAELQTARRTGLALDERWHLRKDGGRVFLRGVVRPLSDGGFLKIARDESERQRGEQALRRSRDETERQRRLYDAILANTPDFAYVFDLDHRFVYANDVLLRTWGRSWEQAIGKTCLELGYPDWHAAMHDREIEQVIATKQPIRGVVPFDGTFGRRMYDYIFVPVFGPDGEVEAIVGTTRDATEQIKAEAELRVLAETLEQRVDERTGELMAAEEALRQSQKMEAVGQLTGGLAHDFNNLLTGIAGNLELLGKRVAQGRLAGIDRYVTAAQDASRRAAALTHRLLAFSRRQTLDPKPTDINRLVADMEDMIRRTVGPEITVEVIADDALWATLIDAGQLENALLNLCINARDAMPGGGRLTIETANVHLDARAARERDLSPGQYVQLCVTDIGQGMTPEVIARAFDPFFTTKPLGEGTGLGLSMVYGFVRQSGGQARIYSEIGHGAKICLKLPRHTGEVAADRPTEAAAPGPAVEHGRTVLVVEDEPTIRALVAEVLDGLGCTVIEAEDGAAGLRVLLGEAAVDLLITDVGLPGGINGRQIADAARERRPGLKVLFITGYADTAAVRDGHLEPGMHVLTKPFAMDALAARIRELIASA